MYNEAHVSRTWTSYCSFSPVDSSFRRPAEIDIHRYNKRIIGHTPLSVLEILKKPHSCAQYFTPYKACSYCNMICLGKQLSTFSTAVDYDHEVAVMLLWLGLGTLPWYFYAKLAVHENDNTNAELLCLPYHRSQPIWCQHLDVCFHECPALYACEYTHACGDSNMI